MLRKLWIVVKALFAVIVVGVTLLLVIKSYGSLPTQLPKEEVSRPPRPKPEPVNVCMAALERVAAPCTPLHTAMETILTIESGKHPWVAFVNEGKLKGSYRWETREKALAALDSMRLWGLETDNVDMGCWQVNMKWHGDRLQTPRLAYKPEHNVAVAINVFERCLSRHSQVIEAIGCYHSGTAKHANRYKGKARPVMAKIQKTCLMKQLEN